MPDVWEDSVPIKGSVYAFIRSGMMMQDWAPFQYITSHGKGVDEPVVHVNDQGSVVVAWNDLRDGTGQTYLRISHDGGKPFDPEAPIARERRVWGTAGCL